MHLELVTSLLSEDLLCALGRLASGSMFFIYDLLLFIYYLVMILIKMANSTKIKSTFLINIFGNSGRDNVA